MESYELTHTRLTSILHYDPSISGPYGWKWLIDINPSAGIFKNSVAGCAKRSREKNYWIIRLDGKTYQAHNLAFFYMMGHWPIKLIDHIDRDSLNNRWNNLREATFSQNQFNRRIGPNNSSGMKNVSFDKNRNSWKVHFCINGKQKQFRCKDFEMACLIADEFREKYHGEFAHAK